MVNEEKLSNAQKEKFYRDAAVLLAAKVRDRCINLEWKSLFFFAISILAKYGMMLAAAIILYLHGNIGKAILFSCFCIVYSGAQKIYQRAEGAACPLCHSFMLHCLALYGLWQHFRGPFVHCDICVVYLVFIVPSRYGLLGRCQCAA